MNNNGVSGYAIETILSKVYLFDSKFILLKSVGLKKCGFKCIIFNLSL